MSETIYFSDIKDRAIAKWIPAEVHKYEAEALLDGFLVELTKAVAAGEYVILQGFGTFKPNIRRLSGGLNPLSSKGGPRPSTRKGTVTISFRPARTLKADIFEALKEDWMMGEE